MEDSILVGSIEYCLLLMCSVCDCTMIYDERVGGIDQFRCYDPGCDNTMKLPAPILTTRGIVLLVDAVKECLAQDKQS